MPDQVGECDVLIHSYESDGMYTGSGTVVARRNGKSFILTNWHVTHAKQGGAKFVVVLPKLNLELDATYVDGDQANDLALISVDRELKFVTVAETHNGEPVQLRSFPGGATSLFMVQQSQITGTTTKPEGFVVSQRFAQGQSGGGVYCNQKLCGVIYGTSIGGHCTGLRPVRALLARVLGTVPQSSPQSSAAPSLANDPLAQPPASSLPSTAAPICAGDCHCGDELAAFKKSVTELRGDVGELGDQVGELRVSVTDLARGIAARDQQLAALDAKFEERLAALEQSAQPRGDYATRDDLGSVAAVAHGAIEQTNKELRGELAANSNSMGDALAEASNQNTSRHTALLDRMKSLVGEAEKRAVAAASQTVGVAVGGVRAELGKKIAERASVFDGMSAGTIVVGALGLTGLPAIGVGLIVTLGMRRLKNKLHGPEVRAGGGFRS